jgi:ABC-type branched-subunit amino acid transport system ATPase component
MNDRDIALRQAAPAGIAVAIAAKPRMLLLDEPAAGVPKAASRYPRRRGGIAARRYRAP